MLNFPHIHLPPHSGRNRTLGVLTSGGDSPGMNAAIRAIVRFSLAQGCKIFGIYRGYSGLLEGDMEELLVTSVANIIQRGGTILKTDRCEEFFKKSIRKTAVTVLQQRGIDGLIVIGGDGSFTGAHFMERENDFPVIGIPATIDNDIYGTDVTIGFDTAVNTALEAIDRIRDTASSHNRIFIVEVMGHSSGFIGIQVGMGGGAETIILPEKKNSIGTICNTIERGMKRGKTSSIIVVAEGPKPGLSTRLATDLDRRGYRTRVCILGHTQRGGSPSAQDRVVASILGASAVAYLLSGKSNAMVGVKDNKVVLVPLKDVIGKKKETPSELIQLSQILST